MLGPIDYAVWLICMVAQVGVVVCAIGTCSFRRYFTLNFYILASLFLSVGRVFVLFRFGYTSTQYFHFYYFSDALLTICLYLALTGLYAHVFDEMGAAKYLRVGAILLLAGTSLVSYLIVDSSRDRMLTRFVVELSQNLYFVGVVLTYLLWGAMLKLRETRTRLVQLVLALGVYFSAFAGCYALRNLHPDWQVWRYVSHLMAIWLPVAWSYTFLKIPEEARLATARLAATRSR